MRPGTTACLASGIVPAILALSSCSEASDPGAGPITDPNEVVSCEEGGIDLSEASEAATTTFITVTGVPFIGESGQAAATEEIILCVPADVLSLSLAFRATEPGTGQRYAFSTFRTPEGDNLVDATDENTILLSPLRQTQSPSLGVDFASIMYPQNPQTQPSGGRYVLQAVASEALNRDLMITIRRGTRQDNGVIPLNLISVGGAIASEEDAANIDRALSIANEFLTQRAISLGLDTAGVGKVNDTALESIILPSADDADPPANVPAALIAAEVTESETRTLGGRNALNLYLVKELVLQQAPDLGGEGSGSEVVALGVSMGAPGAYIDRHGVFLALEPHRLTLQSGGTVLVPDLLAGTLAHEISHWLGLYHTSELDGRFHDRIDDTAQCERSADNNDDGIVQPGECQDSDANNFMFWTVDPEAPVLSSMTISEDQGALIRLNPVVVSTVGSP